MNQPNILLITVDQMRFDHLGLKGVKGIDTPNLDRLGREGIHFDRAYTPSPLCTPARMSLLTGQYPSVHGAYTIGVTVDPFPHRTLPMYLGERGYATALVGKAHFVARADEPAHVAGVLDPAPEFFARHTGPYVGFDEAQVAVHHTTNGVPACHYRAWLEAEGVDYSQWYPDVDGAHDHAQTGVWDIPAQYHDSTWITQKTIDFVSRNGDAGRPWFCWASYNDPHEPFVCPEPWFSAVRMEEAELYEGYREGEFEDKPSFYKQAFEQGFPKAWAHQGIGVPCASARRDLAGKAREALQATLGMVAMIDHEVGRLLDALESSGQAENTLVVFTCDHGELHQHHGLWHKGLFAYEDVQRIPFLVWGPGWVKATGTSAALVNLVDLPRTFLSLAGAPVSQGVQGTDLTPLFSGTATTVQDATLVELQATKAVYQQSFITDRYKLVVYRDATYGEVYDLQNDPDQYKNLWGDPESAEIKTDLLQRLAQFHMRREGHVHDRKAFA